LLQTGRGVQSAAQRVGARVTSDCGDRLQMREQRNAACIVVRGGRALLVWVPYGSAPGWDLPGGGKHDGEVACETAEREVCEETGMQVRAVKQLSYNVFQCDTVAENVCRSPVDEGFLGKHWASLGELKGLQYRGNTWGDKEGLLARALAGHALTQTSQVHASAPAVLLARQSTRGVTSDCPRRLQHWSESNSACIVVRDNRALLVWVPYGSSPGWDLPGGWKHDGEAACETAERETCEESGIKVLAVKKLSFNVFQCEVLAFGACRNPVDEGFLAKKWASRDELDSLQYRGGTWGDKRGILKQALGSASPSPGPPSSTWQPDWADACGCKMCQGEGFSSSSQQCRAGAATGADEACACLRRGGGAVDACGCRACDGEGWSSTQRSCSRGAETSPEEACQCRRDGGRAPAPAPAPAPGQPDSSDACGCKMCEGQGFSSTSQQCGAGSATGPGEACECLRRRGGGALLDACGCRACDGEGWSSTQRGCSAGAETSPEEGCQCQRGAALAQIA